jgi:predicted methyltransferase
MKFSLSRIPLVWVLGAVVALVGCRGLNPAASERLADGAVQSNTVPGSAIMDPAVVDAALNHPQRRSVDREQDERRETAAVLSFFGIDTGMTVLDLYSGGGYYAELLSYLVGPTGRVVAHNNTPYLSFAKDELAVRYSDDRLPNVEQLVAENNELELESEIFDAVLLIKAYHDIYYVDEEEGWAEIDRELFLGAIYASMKSGGVLGIVDHVAAPGSPASTGGTLHRIDPELIKRDMAAAGFRYDGQSNVLRNPDDDFDQGVFDPAVRDHTDRIVMRFRKP